MTGQTISKIMQSISTSFSSRIHTKHFKRSLKKNLNLHLRTLYDISNILTFISRVFLEDQKNQAQSPCCSFHESLFIWWRCIVLQLCRCEVGLPGTIPNAISLNIADLYSMAKTDRFKEEVMFFDLQKHKHSWPKHISNTIQETRHKTLWAKTRVQRLGMPE